MSFRELKEYLTFLEENMNIRSKKMKRKTTSDLIDASLITILWVEKYGR